MKSFLQYTGLATLCALSLGADAKVHEYQLDNGLRILVKEDHRAPVVISEVWYKVGSSYEPLGITGISHMLEHMMFKGTKKFGPGQLSTIVSNNGGQQNAFTADDYTGYYQLFEKSKLPISFELEADRMQNLIFDQAEFTKEHQVVMEERRLRTDDDPQSLTLERFMAAAHISSPYHHPIIGWMSDINQLTLADLKSWYENWYAPNNATVVVVGDVVPDEVFELAKRHFGSIPAKNFTPVKETPEIVPLGKREIVVKTPAKLPWLVMGYNVPTAKTAKELWEVYALDVVTGILDGGRSARFEKEIVREKEIASSISAGYSPFDRLDSLLTISATPAAKHNAADVKLAILNQIEKLKKELVTPSELARVKAQVVAQKIYKKDSIADQAYEIGGLESVGLSWRLSEDYVKNIQAVTPAQIQKVAKKYLIEDRLTIAVLEPLPLTGKESQAPSTAGEGHVH
ncbi:MAG: insulinase family protein [Gammaproteobacteria bacterium]|nr:insulinase family protein [Gammaproteobacteria bacterium]